jgi:hypothetical protein
MILSEIESNLWSRSQHDPSRFRCTPRSLHAWRGYPGYDVPQLAQGAIARLMAEGTAAGGARHSGVNFVFGMRRG